MKKRKLLSCLLAAACVASLVSGCGNESASTENTSTEEKTSDEKPAEEAEENEADSAEAETKTSDHEPLTFMYNVGGDTLIEAVHEKYPEINLQQIPYNGGNRSWYALSQMLTGEMPDLFNTLTAWMTYSDDVTDHLVDLSTYSFTDNILPTQLRDVEKEGKVYLMPCNYDLLGIVYNKTLFEEHGWTLPTSFEELKELAPQIEAAGVNLAISNDTAVGYDFQYLCNLADTLGLSDLDGVQWQKDFLKGEASAEEGFGEALDYMQEWVDLGMLVTQEQAEEKYGYTGTDPFEFFAEGNTAFYMGNLMRQSQNADGTGDQFALMPYLSKDGTNNKVITTVGGYWGINKELEEPGNEQKLEDALHVMEVFASVEGQNALNKRGRMLNTLVNGGISADEDSPYYLVLNEVYEGNSAPFLYDAWMNVIVGIGTDTQDFCNGKQTRDETIAAFDAEVQRALENPYPVYAHADEVIGIDAVTRLVGQAYCEEVGADLALVSQNVLREDGNIQNTAGVNGTILPVDMNDEYIAVFTPGGRNGKITTVTLTGSRIREVQAQGYDTNSTDGLYDSSITANFPYVLVTKEGFELDDDAEYTVVVCRATDALREEGNAVDTDVLGSAAVQHYFDKLGNPMHFTEKDIQWK